MFKLPPSDDVDTETWIKYWEDRADKLNTKMTHLANGNPVQDHDEDTSYQFYYRDIIDVLKGISRRFKSTLKKDEFHRVENIFDDVVRFALEKFEKYIIEQTPRDSILKWHPVLYKLRAELSSAPYGVYNSRIYDHATRLGLFLRDHEPEPEEAWQDGELLDNEEFSDYFKKFTDTRTWRVETKETRCNYIQTSKSFLMKALRSLNLSETFGELPLELFDGDSRPTYVDSSCKSEEFLYGMGGRLGALGLKQKLGGGLTSDEKAKVDEARRKRRRKSDQVKSPKVSAEGNKKRTDDSFVPTIEKVRRDIRDMCIDAGFRYTDWVRPTRNQLLTPTVAIKKATLESYQEDLANTLQSCENQFFNPDEPPRGTEEQKSTCEELAEAIAELRIDALRKKKTNPSDIKAARLLTFRIKYLRSLQMILILRLSSTSDRKDILESSKARLADWTLHEKIWNVGDEKSAQRRSLKESNRSALQAAIAARKENIEAWKYATKKLDKLISSEPDELEHPDAHEDDKAPEEEDRMASQASRRMVVSLRRHRRPHRSMCAMKWVEDHLEAAEETALDKLIREMQNPQPVVEPVDETRIVVGGPPDFEELPTRSVWDRVLYMFVITHWRALQLERDLKEPVVTSDILSGSYSDGFIW